MYIHTHVCLYSLLLCYVFICMLLHVQANTCSKVSYKILSWRGKIGWQQDDSSVRNACVPTRGVWGHASQENLHPLRLLLMESRTKTVAGGRKIPAPPSYETLCTVCINIPSCYTFLVSDVRMWLYEVSVNNMYSHTNLLPIALNQTTNLHIAYHMLIHSRLHWHRNWRICGWRQWQEILVPPHRWPQPELRCCHWEHSWT